MEEEDFSPPHKKIKISNGIQQEELDDVKLDERLNEETILPEEQFEDKETYLKYNDNPIFKAPFSQPQINSIDSNKMKTLMRSTMEKFSKEYYPAKEDLNGEQYQVLIQAMLGKSLGLFGIAGSGKTKTLKHVIKHLKNRDICVYITASTGTSAQNLGLEATTLHKFMGVGLCEKPASVEAKMILQNAKLHDQWCETEVLIIDEISMIEPELFDKLNDIAQRVRGNKLPFGGIQLIVCGDFAQLEPVIVDRNKLSKKYKDMHYCFETQAWKKCFSPANTFLLKENFRQKSDPQFIKILDEIRFGNVSEASIKILQNLVQSDKDYDNYCRYNNIYPTVIYPIKKMVDRENQKRLDELKGEKYTYEWKIIPKNLSKQLEKKYYAFIIKQVPVEKELHLKIGANVILLKNLSVKAGLCNGSQGIVIGFDNNSFPIVKFSNGVQTVIEPCFWTYEKETSKYSTQKSLNWRNSRFSGMVLSHIPLKLGFAITVHKSQSLTLPNVRLDLSKLWSAGHAYVAITRAPSLANISLKSFDPKSIIFSPKVVDFYNNQVSLPSTQLLHIINHYIFGSDIEDDESEQEQENNNNNNNEPISFLKQEIILPSDDEQDDTQNDNGEDPEPKSHSAIQFKKVSKKWRKFLSRIVQEESWEGLTLGSLITRLIEKYPKKEKKITKRKKYIRTFVKYLIQEKFAPTSINEDTTTTITKQEN